MLFLIVLVILFFLPFIFQPELLTEKDNDLGRNYIPIFHFISDSFTQSKSLPMWRQEQMMGETLIGNPLSTLLYPANILFLILPVDFASTLYYTIHLIIASVATFTLAKSFKLSETVAFAVAVFYTFSNKLLLHISAGHITMVASFALFPVFFLGIRYLLLKPSYKALIISSFSACFMLLTYPTVFYYAAMFVLLYTVYFLLNSKTNLIQIKKAILLVSLLLVLVIMLSAIFLIPQLEFASLSTRPMLTLEDVAIPVWNIKYFLSSLFFPFPYINVLDHEAFLYLGFVPLILATKGFFKLRKNTKIILVVSGLLTLLFVTGTSTPFFKFAYEFLPLLKYSRVTTRLWFVVALVVALLAGSSLERIKNKKLVYLLILVFLVESLSIGYLKIFSIPNLNFSNNKLFEYLSQDKDIFRVYCTSYCFNPQQAFANKLQLLNGETPLQQTNSVKILEEAGNYNYEHFNVIFPPYQIWQVPEPPQPNADMLAKTNVKYIASTYELNNFRFIAKFQDVLLYKNENFKPRYYFENANQKVKIVRHSPNEVVLKFNPLEQTRRLVISENYYPGWSAQINNKRYKVELFDKYFKSVQVPAGTDHASLIFQPESFVFGKTITTGTILFLVIFFWYNSTKNRRV